MKKLLKRAGLEAKQTVFLFTDTQIIHETFLEVRTVLSSTQKILAQATAGFCSMPTNFF